MYQVPLDHRMIYCGSAALNAVGLKAYTDSAVSKIKITFFPFQVDEQGDVNDVDLNLYVPKAVDETGITVASLERFSTYTSAEKDGKICVFCVLKICSSI